MTKEAITRMRMVRRRGMSERATIQPMGAATRQHTTLTEMAMTSVVISGSTKTGSVKSVRKLASVTLRARSVKAKATSHPIGSTTSRHRTAANSAITAPDRSRRGRNARASGAGSASTLTTQPPCRPRATPSPLGEKVPEGRMRGPSRAKKEVPPHQLGRMTYGRAPNVSTSCSQRARDRKSWPRALSPTGRGGACMLALCQMTTSTAQASVKGARLRARGASWTRRGARRHSQPRVESWTLSSFSASARRVASVQRSTSCVPGLPSFWKG